MDLAKVPDCDVPQWEYVDIYVFSNGQQQTPPRKYHLKSNELEEWQDTLRTLAQSQYGAKQCMIDLYTVDGLKVATPIEIVHENAYVAVPRHDDFIPAGYSEYMLKASRSREKRMSKLKKPITLALVRAEQEKKKPIGKVAESRSPTVGGGTTTHNTTTSSGDQNAPQAQTINNNNNISEKFLDKRTLNNSTLLRKNNPNISGEIIRKPSMKSKENLSRKNLKVSTGKIGSKDPVLIINHSNSLKTKGKVITKIGKDNTLIDTQKKMENMPVIPNAENNSLKVINEKITTTESALIENVIDDKELIVVKNPDSMILDANKNGSKSARQTVTSTTMPVLPLLEESKTSQINEQETTLNSISEYVENVNKPQGAVNNELTSQKKNDVNVNRPSKMLNNQDSPKRNVLINDNRPTENFVSLIEKGDIVSLNLQIEVRKYDGVIKTRYDTNTQNLRSITEKCSQVEIDEKFVQSIEKQSNVIDSMVLNEENPKVIVLQCACCGNQDFNEMLQKIDTSFNLEDKKYIILLPNPEYEKHMQRCHCGLESKVDSARFSVIDPLQKVHADTKLLNKTENNDTKDDTVEKTQTIGVSASQIQSSSRYIQKEELIYNNTANNDMSKEKNTNPESALLQKNTDDNVLVSYENANPELNTVQSNISRNTREPESLNIRKNASNVTKQFKESSVQTEWSSLLLEARRHDDGLYSFHLPPLSILKCYFL